MAMCECEPETFVRDGAGKVTLAAELRELRAEVRRLKAEVARLAQPEKVR